MTTDYDEELGYDADHDDPGQFCQHGTFIGSWWGPDYMCFYCEMGISVEQLRREAKRARKVRAAKRFHEYEHMRQVLQDTVPTLGFNPKVALILVDLVQEGRWPS